MTNTIVKTEFNFPNQSNLYKGKVRDVYTINNDKLIMIATDRISAFDFVFDDTILGRGVLLNKLSLFWFNMTKDIVKNHIVDIKELKINELGQESRDRCMLVKKTKVVPIEAIVRGYLAGSAWEFYKKTKMINNKKSNVLFIPIGKPK